ncbi:MAG: type II toxin-antitoxin system mRNA interferase toxin, RelE/StbE family [Candidatus Uhrbacteria bacterium]
MEVTFSPSFLGSLRTLQQQLQNEVFEKIDLFSDIKNHKILKVHKLKGRLRGCYSFSVNYHIRIVFEFVGKPRRAYLLAIGDHEVYN